VGRRRPDIQGLRALAVLAVVAYHAGLPVPGGFVGVDVFFVISGYVITSMLRREWEATGRIHLGAFYLRRFKRLMPALALVVAFTLAASGLVLSPLGPQKTALETGLGSLGLVANWVVSATTGGYFDAPAATNPFLHTWSLSVEEQFYLLFPALLMVAWRLARRRPDVPVLLVSAVAGISFVVALVGVNPFVHSWLFGFYSPVRRAWEFAVGALLVLVPVPRRSAWLGVAGAAGLAASLWAIDSSTPFPGIWTLLPVGAAALLLAAAGPVTRVLSLRPLVQVGDWSYSIYLWHWPLIVLARVLWPDSAHAPLLAAAVAFVPAVCSYAYLEQPLRTLRLRSRVRVAVLVAAVLCAPLAVDGALAATVPGVWSPGYRTQALQQAYSGAIGQDFLYRYLSAQYRPCAPVALRAASPRWQGTVRCWQSRPGPLDVALIGDSHAEHLFVGLAQARPSLNVGYYIVADNPTMQEPEFARIVRTVAASRQTVTVVVNAFWSVRRMGRADLQPVLETLAAAHKRVFTTDDVPWFPFDAFDCKYRPAVLSERCTIPASQFAPVYEDYFPGIAAAVHAVPGVHLIRTAGAFCNHVACSMVEQGKLLYRDDDHLNIAGSRYVAAAMLRDPVFAAAMRPRGTPGTPRRTRG
jgi:peptidoglycan/LPS O-acetylase OafA/YrhL